MTEREYRIKMSLNVLNHLGLNLYSNIPAVLSEAVANSWDADAENVYIEVNRDEGYVSIEDDGHGMTYEEVNEKYLNVGYPRREREENYTPHFKRPVMGRKGIGKLSLFSIAETVELYTVKNEDENALRMNVEEMRKSVETQAETYHPDPIENTEKESEGTKILLKQLKKRLTHTESSLRKRLARRFSIIGDEYKFNIYINNSIVTLEDRDYFHKVQYLWRYGEESEKYKNLCTNLKEEENRPDYIDTDDDSNEYKIHGWIGTVKNSGDLKDEKENLNKIVIMVRGKVAQEDILEDFSEGGIYSKYVFGEINADFLDRDDLEDITTTSRQKIIEDDPRYQKLKNFIGEELKHIRSKWTDLRNERGTQEALELETIKEWYESLDKSLKNKAKQLFGKINQIPIEPEEDKFMLLQYGVLAFESLRYKDQLDALENISPNNLPELTKILSEFDDIEASLYHRIASERIRIIKTLQDKVEESVLEKVIQDYIFNHLWILDPSWERATKNVYMEQQVQKAFEDVDKKELTEEEKKGRIDIRYVTTYGKHLIIELKKSDRAVKTTELADQIDKYRSALQKCLVKLGYDNPHIECVCILGTQPPDWSRAGGQETSKNILQAVNARILFYQNLLENAYSQYQEYLQANEKAGRITNFVEKIGQEISSKTPKNN